MEGGDIVRQVLRRSRFDQRLHCLDVSLPRKHIRLSKENLHALSLSLFISSTHFLSHSRSHTHSTQRRSKRHVWQERQVQLKLESRHCDLFWRDERITKIAFFERNLVAEMSDMSTGKTLFVLAVVLGCFAVLWPKIFSPMLFSTYEAKPKPGKLLHFQGGSPSLVVIGDDSCSRGCGFESRRRILDGHDSFSH